MRRSQTKPDQLDLFGPMGRTCPLQTPQWQNLPCQTRNEVTMLVVRLLVEHGRRQSKEPGAVIVDPLLGREGGDV